VPPAFCWPSSLASLTRFCVPSRCRH